MEQTRERIIQEHAAALVMPAAVTGTIFQTQAELARCTARLEEWAKANRRKEFQGAKSIELISGGWLRFRLGNRSLALLAGWTWPKVKERMLKGKKAWGKFIRRVPEIDKQKILAATSVNTTDETGWDRKTKSYRYASALQVKLRKIGMRVAQEETFTVELHEGDSPVTSAATAEKAPNIRYSITEPVDACRE